jgi:hypothetical protein
MGSELSIVIQSIWFAEEMFRTTDTDATHFKLLKLGLPAGIMWNNVEWIKDSCSKKFQSCLERMPMNRLPSMSGFRLPDDEEAGIVSRANSLDDEERVWLLRRQEQPGWRVDHGAGVYQEDRDKKKVSYLVETGR